MILTALVGAALLAGCGGGDDAGQDSGATAPAKAATATDSIEIKDFLFDPDPATVKVGTKVSVSNADSAPHTLTEEGGKPSFDSGTIKGNQSGSVTFEETGTFKYFCEFHATMKGTVTVVQ
jgi:plastocyanin